MTCTEYSPEQVKQIVTGKMIDQKATRIFEIHCFSCEICTRIARRLSPQEFANTQPQIQAVCYDTQGSGELEDIHDDELDELLGNPDSLEDFLSQLEELDDTTLEDQAKIGEISLDEPLDDAQKPKRKHHKNDILGKTQRVRISEDDENILQGDWFD